MCFPAVFCNVGLGNFAKNISIFLYSLPNLKFHFKLLLTYFNFRAIIQVSANKNFNFLNSNFKKEMFL